MYLNYKDFNTYHVLSVFTRINCGSSDMYNIKQCTKPMNRISMMNKTEYLPIHFTDLYFHFWLVIYLVWRICGDYSISGNLEALDNRFVLVLEFSAVRIRDPVRREIRTKDLSVSPASAWPLYYWASEEEKLI